MKTKTEKTFDSVKFFRAIKEKLAARMEGMTLSEQKEFMRKVREGKIKIAWIQIHLTKSNRSNTKGVVGV